MEKPITKKQKMVAGFRRSLSFSSPIPNRLPPPEKRYHVRSASLPCRSHPLISQLKDEINELKTRESKPETRTYSWLCDGLTRLKNVHDSLDDLLLLPQTQESLRHHCDWVENLLEDFLCFADVYGLFREALLMLKEEQLVAQMALRRRDESKMCSYLKARKRMDKEIAKLISVVRLIGKGSIPGSDTGSMCDKDAELAGILREVNELTVSVSVSLFNNISSSSSSSSFFKSSWIGWKSSKKIKIDETIQDFQEVGVENLCHLKKRGEEEVRMALRKLQALEDCIVGIESESERVFRSLINTRVSLLNILTH